MSGAAAALILIFALRLLKPLAVKWPMLLLLLVNSILEAKFLDRSGPLAILDLAMAAMFKGGEAAWKDEGIEEGIGMGIEEVEGGGPKPGGGDGGPREAGSNSMCISAMGVCSMPPSRDPVRSPRNACGLSHASSTGTRSLGGSKTAS